MKYEEFVGQYPIDMSEFKKNFWSMMDLSGDTPVDSAGFLVGMGKPEAILKIKEIACAAPILRLWVGKEEHVEALQPLGVIPLVHPYYQDNAYLEVLRAPLKRKKKCKQS